jgi:hypothetical protein
MFCNSIEEESAMILVFSVIRKVSPVAVAEIGLGITRLKASFASGDVDLELLHATTTTARTIKTEELKHVRTNGKLCMVECLKIEGKESIAMPVSVCKNVPRVSSH